MQTTTTTKAKKPAKANFSAPIAEIHLVPLDLIDIHEQIRTEFNEESIQELANDIQIRGLIQPVLLNPNDGRFTMIAGERRLRAIRLNGQTAIPALLTKVSADDAKLMQLAENIQREELSYENECNAIIYLYKKLGSLKEVANKVKKSVPWCSKRYASNIHEWHSLTRELLIDGISEDMELLKTFDKLADLISWTDAREFADKIRRNEIGRNEIRAALKAAKEAQKQAKEKAEAKLEKVSHAKTKEPPPPPAWTLENALDDISRALTYPYAEQSAIELYQSWTTEQQNTILGNLHAACCLGKTEDSFKTISKLIIYGTYDSPFIDIELTAMVWGYDGKEFEIAPFLEQLQIPPGKRVNLANFEGNNMTEKMDNLVLEQLRSLRNEILAFRAENQGEFSEIKHRLTRLESSVASMRGESIGTQEDVYRQQSVIDQIKERLQRIEKRLEIANG